MTTGNANLSGVDFSDANLENSNLSDAILIETQFSGANLRNVNLSRANLSSANLTYANLEKCALVGAQLYGTDFSESVLSYSELSDAYIDGSTVFVGADLRNARIWSIHWGHEVKKSTQIRDEIQGSPMFYKAKINGIEYKDNSWIEDLRRRCFISGTRIKLADGNSKNVEDVKIGDKLLSYCTRTNQPKVSVVQSLMKADTDSIIVINDRLFTTSSELISTGTEWKLAGEMRIGDSLYVGDRTVNITSIEYELRLETVFNFVVLPYHSFFANEVLVHNGVKYLSP